MNYEKQKITAILPAKSGIGKNGKPYSFYKIKTDKQGDKILTTFGDKVTEGWQVGDEIEINVTTSISPDGRFTNYNFEYPKAPPIGLRIESLELRIVKIENYLRSIPKTKLTEFGTPMPFDKESQEEYERLPIEQQKANSDNFAERNIKSNPLEYPEDEFDVSSVPF